MSNKLPFSKPDLFQFVSEEIWEYLHKLFVLKEFKAGEKIISQGDKETQYFYIVSSGMAEIFVNDENGHPLHLAYIYPGDYFGERALLVEEENSTTVVAYEDTQIYILSREHFYQFLAQHPDLSRHFIWTLTQRLHRTNLLLEENEYKKMIIDLVYEESKVYHDVPFIGKTENMREVFKEIERTSTNSLPVLIESEYGSGKQLVAWQIHSRTAKNKKAFITVDGGALTEKNWEELLFGREHIPPFRSKEHSFGYFELAEGGTLFIKNCDQLSLPLQQKIREILQKQSYTRLDSQEIKRIDFRLVAATRIDLSQKLKNGEFDPLLYQMLTCQMIKLPPLRERKKMIPGLVTYFIEKYARLSNKNVTGITPDAMKELLNHDYKLANIKELEQIIERAVALPSDNKIWTRHLFLGAPAVKPDNWYYNLLKIKVFGKWVREKIYPEKLQYLTASFFALLILVCFLGPRNPSQNPAVFLVWGVWWPFMFLSFFWIGRTWCSICAYANYGRFVQRIKHYNVPLPYFIRKNEAIFVTIGFLIILWAEEITHMRSSPRATGCLMISMLSLALICAVIFRRESWCRYLCPMGGLIGVCSMSSVIELRSDTTVCANQCKKTECYNGTPENPGCPMFQHLLFVDNNQTCKLCLQCIRNCPNQSVSLNLRLPGREIWLSNQVRDKMSFFVFALLGVVLPLIYMVVNNLTLHSKEARLFYSMAHFLLPIAIGAILWLPSWLFSDRGFNIRWLSFWHTSYAYVPLALSTHIAYQLWYLPGGRYLHYLLQSPQQKLFQGPIIQPFQILTILLGLFFSWFCLWQIYKHHQNKTFKTTKVFWLSHVLLMGGYVALVLNFLIHG